MHTARLVVAAHDRARRRRSVRWRPATRTDSPGSAARAAADNRDRASRAMIGARASPCCLAFVAADRQPVDWVGRPRRRVPHAGTPDLTAQGSRFGFNAGSNRYDAWRVALSDFGDDPLVRRRRWRLPLLLPAASATRTPEPPRRPQRRDGAALRARLRRLRAARGRRRRAPSRARSGAADSALGARLLSAERPRRRQLLARPHLGRLVLALPGDHGAGAGAARLSCGARRPRRRAALDPRVAVVGDRRPRRARGQRRSPPSSPTATSTRAADELADRPADARSPTSTAPTTSTRSTTSRCCRGPDPVAPSATARRALATFREAADLRPEECATHYLIAELEREHQRCAWRRTRSASRSSSIRSTRGPRARRQARRSRAANSCPFRSCSPSFES